MSSNNNYNQIGRGLENLGNSCYLNSVMQALFHIPAFTQWLLTNEEHNKDCKVCFICILLNTYRDSQSTIKRRSFPPKKIFSKIQDISNNFYEGVQEDAHECFIGIIGAINNAHFLRSGIYPLESIFGGTLRNSYWCHSCGNDKNNFTNESVFQIYVNVTNKNIKSISDGVKDFFNDPELIKYHCEICSNNLQIKTFREANKIISITLPPNIICVQLNRFANDNITKLTRTIFIDLELDLTNYTILQGNPTNYRLRSVICHEGETLSNGHYIAFGWTNKGFYEFNDEKVSPISDTDLQNKEAYLVFYEKYNPVSLEDTVDSSSIGDISESERMKPLRNNMETRKFLKRAYQSSTGSSFSKKIK